MLVKLLAWCIIFPVSEIVRRDVLRYRLNNSSGSTRPCEDTPYLLGIHEKIHFPALDVVGYLYSQIRAIGICR